MNNRNKLISVVLVSTVLVLFLLLVSSTALENKDSKGNSHDRTEVIWMNKYYLKALKEQKVPIELTEKEFKQGKVNQSKIAKKNNNQS